MHRKTYQIIFLELSSESSGVIMMRTWSGQGPPGETWECNRHGKRQNREGEWGADLSWIFTVWAQLFLGVGFSVSWNKMSLKKRTEETLINWEWPPRVPYWGSSFPKSPEERFEPSQHLDFRLTELILDVNLQKCKRINVHCFKSKSQ